MASGTALPDRPAPTPRPAAAVDYGALVERQLRRARGQVKLVDLFSAVLQLLCGLVAFAVVVAALDHWVITGGLGAAGRTICFLALLSGLVWYGGRVLWPLLRRGINPVFAAHTIEQSRSGLKNSLVNFLLLRSRRGEVPEAILATLEQKAAADLNGVRVESTVDRTRLTRMGILLGVAVMASVAYQLFWSKGTWRSLERVAMPWSDLTAPTEIAFTRIEPGDATVFSGDVLRVTTEIAGRGADEELPVYVVFSTSDGQIVGRELLMSPSAGEPNRRELELPPSRGGFQQDVEYYLAARDARSQLYKVRVTPPPAISVTSVEYEFPGYTGLDKLTQQHGDIKALEGTKVTLRARANQDISSAHVDFDCDGRNDLAMKVAGQEATATFTLALRPDRVTPEHASYQIRFKNAQRHENPQPIRYPIEVAADKPPVVAIVKPAELAVELPANGVLPIALTAADPDFALRRLNLRFERDGVELLAAPLLPEPPAPAKVGPFQAAYSFDAGRLPLKAGDEVVYWAEAVDNKDPGPNSATSTPRRTIKITSPVDDKNREQQLADARREQQRHDAENRPEPPRDEPQPRDDRGAQPPGEQPQPPDAQPNEKPAEAPRNDQNPPADEPKNEQPRDDRNAFDKIRERQDAEQRPDQKPQPGENLREEKQPGEQQRDNPGEPGQGTGQGEKKPGAKGSGAGEKSPQQGTGEQGAGDQSADGKTSAGQKQPAAGGANDKGTGQAGKSPNGQTTGRGDPQGGGENDPARNPGAAQQPMPGAEQRPGDNEGQPSGKSPAGAKQPGDKTTGQQPNNTGGNPASAGEPKANGSADGKRPEQKTGAEQAPADGKGTAADDTTGRAKGGTPNAGEQPMPKEGAGQKSPQKDGGAGNDAKGTPKGGVPDNSDQRGADQQAQNKPTTNKGQPEAGSPPDAADRDPARSPSGSNKDSTTKGATPGDKSGAGQKGPGQSSGQAGQGGSGNASSSEEGQAQSEKSGTGDTVKRPGDKSAAEKPTGQGTNSADRGPGKQAGGDKRNGAGANSQKGAGDNGKEGQTGDGGSGELDFLKDLAEKNPGAVEKLREQAGKDPGKLLEQAKEAAEKNPDLAQKLKEFLEKNPDAADKLKDALQNPGQPPKNPPSADDQRPPNKDNGENGDETSNRGGAGGGPKPPRAQDDPPGTHLGGDDPTLDFARRQTDLQLEYLRDQLAKNKPDQELLDYFGGREEMQRFLDRWDRMKREAQQPGADGDKARQKLDDTLRNLGLQPRNSALSADPRNKDRVQNLKAGQRTAPPADYDELFRAFNPGKRN